MHPELASAPDFAPRYLSALSPTLLPVGDKLNQQRLDLLYQLHVSLLFFFLFSNNHFQGCQCRAENGSLGAQHNIATGLRGI